MGVQRSAANPHDDSSENQDDGAEDRAERFAAPGAPRVLGRQWMLFATCGMLDAAARGGSPLVLRAALDRLADHFDSAPDRARRGMGACPGELREVERRRA